LVGSPGMLMTAADAREVIRGSVLSASLAAQSLSTFGRNVTF
jgi:hypothetical protein